MDRAGTKEEDIEMSEKIEKTQKLLKEKHEKLRKLKEAKKFLHAIENQKTKVRPVACVKPTKVEPIATIPKGTESSSFKEEPVAFKIAGGWNENKALPTKHPIIEDSCPDCLKTFFTKNGVKEHKTKFRCPVNRFSTIKQAAVNSTEPTPNVEKQDNNVSPFENKDTTFFMDKSRMKVRDTTRVDIDSNMYLETMLAVCTNKNKDNEKTMEAPNNESHEMLIQPGLASGIKCQQCGSQFSQKNGLTKHIKRNVCKAKPEKFEEKNIVFKSKEDELNSSSVTCESKTVTLSPSRRIEEINENVESKKTKIDESLQRDSLPEISNLSKSLQDSAENTIYPGSPKCDKCGKTFSAVGNLKRHLKLKRCNFKKDLRSSVDQQKDDSKKWKENNKPRVELTLPSDSSEEVSGASLLPPSSPSTELLESTIEDLMSDVMAEEEAASKKEYTEVKSEPNPSDMIVESVEDNVVTLRPSLLAPRPVDLVGGLSRLGLLAPKLLKGRLSLHRAAAAARLPLEVVAAWLGALHLALPPE